MENNTPNNMNVNDNKPSWLTRKIYETTAEKRRDFWIGFGLWWGLNIVLTLCTWGVYALPALSPAIFDSSTSTYSDLYSVITCVIGLLPWIINLGLIIYFAFTRSQIALGMLAAFGVALLITLCLGVIFAVWCFYALNANNGL